MLSFSIPKDKLKKSVVSDLEFGDLAIVLYGGVNRLVFVYKDINSNSKAMIALNGGQAHWTRIETIDISIIKIFESGEEVTLRVE